MLTPSANVSRIRVPTTYRPFVPESAHNPTLVCSIHRFWISDPVPKLPSSAPSEPLSSRIRTSPKIAKSASVTLLPVPKKPPRGPVPWITDDHGPAPKTRTFATLIFDVIRNVPAGIHTGLCWAAPAAIAALIADVASEPLSGTAPYDVMDSAPAGAVAAVGACSASSRSTS